MSQKKLLFLSLITILGISILHYFSLKLSWYYTHRWIDIVIHILGGFWISVTTLWVYAKIKHPQFIGPNIKAFVLIFTLILCIGIAWEVFELLSHHTFIHTANFWTDSLSDMSNNLIGGVFLYAILIFI